LREVKLWKHYALLQYGDDVREYGRLRKRGVSVELGRAAQTSEEALPRVE
jgi:hypothetical protein